MNIDSVFTSAERIRRRSDGIDLLRGVFALWVVIGHLVPWTRKLQGPDAVPHWLYYFADTIVDRLTQSSDELHPAVLGFIVLSGYCIHRNGLRRPEKDAIASFAIRRCFRILPVFWLAALFPILTLYLEARVSPEQSLLVHGSTSIDACMLAKISTLAALLPIFHECASQANGPLLTVMVECDLYALYAAAFIFLFWCGHARWIFAICTVAYLAGIAVAVLVSLDPSPAHAKLYNWWQNSSVYGFLPYWWLGALAVTTGSQQWLTRNFAGVTAGVLALTALLVVIWYFLDTTYQTAVIAQSRQLLLAVWFAGLIVMMDGVAIHRLNPLPTVGRAGYSLYAFHAPILACLLIYGVNWLLVLAVTITAAFAIYFTIERPTTALGKSLAQRYRTKEIAATT